MHANKKMVYVAVPDAALAFPCGKRFTLEQASWI